VRFAGECRKNTQHTNTKKKGGLSIGRKLKNRKTDSEMTLAGTERRFLRGTWHRTGSYSGSEAPASENQHNRPPGSWPLLPWLTSQKIPQTSSEQCIQP
jgi:hypothetical protein